jgi:hypothetical protein
MWFWCNAPFAWMWWIFPIMFLVCLVMMLFCMRRFSGGHFGCCSPRGYGWIGTSENGRPPQGTEARGAGSRREED